MDNILLSAQNLCAGYGSREILHHISLTLSGGKITAIVGPNGCGKSTLLKTLIRLIPKTDGMVTVCGNTLETLSARELAQRISYLAQNKNIPELTVMTMVLHGRFAHLGYPRRYQAADLTAAKAALETTGLTEYADMPLPCLSGGTQQRVFLAMALAQDTPVILLDEPNSFMDIAHQAKLMTLCSDLSRSGKAVAAVMHDLSAALKYADTMIVMDQGQIAAAGSPEDIWSCGILDKTFHVAVKRTATEDGWCYYYG